MSFEFVIEEGVSIPKREIEFAPRGSQYPFEQMKAGQSFAIPIVGEANAKKEDGTPLTVEEDAKRKSAQKQSYFSSLAKRLGINIVTRYFPYGEPTAENPEPTAENPNGEPKLRAWHNGPRTAAQLAKDAAAKAKAKNKAGTPAPSADDAPAPAFEDAGDELDL